MLIADCRHTHPALLPTRLLLLHCLLQAPGVDPRPLGQVQNSHTTCLCAPTPQFSEGNRSIQGKLQTKAAIQGCSV